jgi:hypothetical protein
LLGNLSILIGVGNGPADKRLCFIEFIYNFSNYSGGIGTFKDSEKPAGKIVDRFGDSTSLLSSYKIVDGTEDES